MNAAIEDHIFDFLAEAFEAAQPGDDLHGVELHDNVFQSIKGGTGVMVGDCESWLSPNAGATEVEEFDGDLMLVVYVRVTGADRTERKTARSQVLALSKAVAKLFFDDPTCGGRVNDARVLRAPRGWDSINSQPHAICNLPLLVNDTGANQ